MHVLWLGLRVQENETIHSYGDWANQPLRGTGNPSPGWGCRGPLGGLCSRQGQLSQMEPPPAVCSGIHCSGASTATRVCSCKDKLWCTAVVTECADSRKMGTEKCHLHLGLHEGLGEIPYRKGSLCQERGLKTLFIRTFNECALGIGPEAFPCAATPVLLFIYFFIFIFILAQDGLELWILLSQSPRVLKLQVCTPHLTFIRCFHRFKTQTKVKQSLLPHVKPIGLSSSAVSCLIYILHQTHKVSGVVSVWRKHV